MEYQALYRKYRPNKFSDVVDQEAILKILINSLKKGHISHAYLFSGPRGTGKTTVAKLLAKTVNCLHLNPDFSICGKCENCLDIMNNSPDIIEIDAASNNGVDEIRELKSKINLVPSKLKYKVYIIDEVHMLSISAFNALLKTLEEPPSHTIFILATTEFYKVPETIVSRCQCLNFTRINISNIEKRLKEIAASENISIDDSAIHAIAEYSEGGMRDALGMLDKLASYSLETITEEDFLTINGLISKKDMDNLFHNILENKPIEVLNNIVKYDELGYDFSKLLEKFMLECRNILVDYYTKENKDSFDPKKIYSLLLCFNDTYNLLRESFNPRVIVEAKLLNFMSESIKEEPKKKKQEMPKNDENIFQEINKSDLGNNHQRYILNEKIKKQSVVNAFAIASKLLKNMVTNKWQKLDDYLLDDKYSVVAGYLKDCTVAVVSDTNIILTASYSSLIDSIYQNFPLVLELLSKILEKSYRIVLLSTEEFEKEVEFYKLHRNDDSYYSYMKEESNLISFPSEPLEKDNQLCYGKLVQKAIEVFGEKNIEIEEDK